VQIYGNPGTGRNYKNQQPEYEPKEKEEPKPKKAPRAVFVDSTYCESATRASIMLGVSISTVRTYADSDKLLQGHLIRWAK
jgi:hypothetical protein